MKKVLAILVIAMFLGGITAPAFASNNSTLSAISLADKDPKKEKKTEKKSGDCDAKAEKKSSDCEAKEAKKDCGGK